MQIFKNIYEGPVTLYPLDTIAPLEKLLFIDIETTGFTAGASYLYLIGCVYFQENSWQTIQWFAENYDEEEALLHEFFKLANSYQCLIHYNGNKFDIPYLQNKCTQHHLFYDFSTFQGVDLYKRLQPYKKFLKLENLKQRTIENFLQIKRDDTYDGGKLISVYHEYVKHPSKESLQLLILHNLEDLKGMLSITPILAYSDLFNSQVTVSKAKQTQYTSSSGDSIPALIMELHLHPPIPKRISYGSEECYFTAEHDHGFLKVAEYIGELKYFYPNYKEYYYLPLEDTAIHKSVASYVDKEFREQAKASNCYIKKTGTYLPQWADEFSPIFRASYGAFPSFFELTDKIKKDARLFSAYAEHLLQTLASQ